jgi:hypothetical protein
VIWAELDKWGFFEGFGRGAGRKLLIPGRGVDRETEVFCLPLQNAAGFVDIIQFLRSEGRDEGI